MVSFPDLTQMESPVDMQLKAAVEILTQIKRGELPSSKGKGGFSVDTFHS